MDKKNLIISKLEELAKIYQLNEDKKWNLRALLIAINAIKKYDGEIISGKHVQSELKGVGEKISKRIDEILKTGTLSELPNTSSTSTSTSTNLQNLLLITGVGIVKAKKWLSLGIKNINDVKKAINDKLIKSTHHIDIGIKYYDDFQQKIPREEIDGMKQILMSMSIIKKFEICGSYRRGALSSGDIDVLILGNNNLLKKIVKDLTAIGFIIDNLTTKGDTKFMGVCRLKQGYIARRIDIRVVDSDAYYTSLIYFTGSKNFNVYIRNKALENNFSLNEYALTNLEDNSKILLKSEKEIFDILKIPYVSPEMRNIS